MQDDFTLVNRGIDRDTCMRLMLESELRKDCESIKGKYNLYELVSQRRNLVTLVPLPLARLRARTHTHFVGVICAFVLWHDALYLSC